MRLAGGERVRVTVRYRTGAVEELSDVDMVHDGRGGLTITHGRGVVHVRRGIVARVDIRMDAEGRKVPELVEAAPYVRAGPGRS